VKVIGKGVPVFWFALDVRLDYMWPRLHGHYQHLRSTMPKESIGPLAENAIIPLLHVVSKAWNELAAPDSETTSDSRLTEKERLERFQRECDCFSLGKIVEQCS
jgi:hypothetical protein